MGKILDTRNAPENTVICRILLDRNEVSNLGGHMKDIHMFSEKKCDRETKVNARGNKGVTKYFKIPLSLRSRKKYNGSLAYQKLENFSKVFFIYTLDKEGTQKEEI